jgi:hypothetical protein
MPSRPAGILALLIGLSVAALAIPPAVAACSCVGPEEQVRMAGQDPRSVVLTGTPGVETPAGVPVTVSRWLAGPGAAPVVTLRVESNEQSSCGTTAPPPGREHLFVLWRDDAGQLLFHLCSVAADVGTEDGRARLAQAQTLFGEGVGPDRTPQATAPSDAGAIAGTIIALTAPLILVLAFGVGLILGVVGVLKKTRFGRD